MAQTSQRTLLGHPTGLYVLFFTEMWERFSYYGMRALLMLYMTNYFLWSQEHAGFVYKWYTSLVYLTPLLGGYLADRFLGNKWAIIIGSVLMAIGHFLMAFEAHAIFYAALVFLIVGNGFFKPNMSVQVGRLYPANDPRRDGAYTIFYMGINLGAFLSPLICGALRKGLGFHWGFGAAGVGMVLGLIIYLLGLPLLKEVPEDAVYIDPDEASKSKRDQADDHVMTEAQAESTPSAVPLIANVSPFAFLIAGICALIMGPVAIVLELMSTDNAIAMMFGGVTTIVASWILSQLAMAVRDRVLAIFILAVFVVFFWGAFEQAGNAMNIWADKTTNRYITEAAPSPSIYPTVEKDVLEESGSVFGLLKKAIVSLVEINPIATESFQSINAAAIFLLAPFFAWLWTFLARIHINLSIATKMAIGVFLMGSAFGLMIFAGKAENQPSQVTAKSLPSSIIVNADDMTLSFADAPEFVFDEKNAAAPEVEEDAEKMIVHGGRLKIDQSTNALNMTGVLNDNHRDRILRSTVSREYLEDIWAFTHKNNQEYAAANKTDATATTGDEAKTETAKVVVTTTYQLQSVPDGFDLKFAGKAEDVLKFDPATRTLTYTSDKALADRDYKMLLVCGADAGFRESLNELYVKSSAFKVSPAWLFWFYILSTLGELCLSPVGLSMVSKLSPKRFATMLMGMWLLTSFFGNFAAGLAGENWEQFAPIEYFMWIGIALCGASLVCFILTRKVTKMMHGVK